MKDHTYIFSVRCAECGAKDSKKILLSLYMEPEIVWRTYLVLSGRSKHVCKKCLLRDFIRKVGASI